MRASCEPRLLLLWREVPQLSPAAPDGQAERHKGGLALPKCPHSTQHIKSVLGAGPYLDVGCVRSHGATHPPRSAQCLWQAVPEAGQMPT